MGEGSGALLTRISTRQLAHEITHPRPRVGWALLAPGLLLAVVTLGLGVGGESLLGLARIAATGLLDTSGFVEAVMAA